MIKWKTVFCLKVVRLHCDELRRVARKHRWLACSRLAAIFCAPPAASRSKNLSLHTRVSEILNLGGQTVIYIPVLGATCFWFHQTITSAVHSACCFSLSCLFHPCMYFSSSAHLLAWPNFKLHFLGENLVGGKIFFQFLPRSHVKTTTTANNTLSWVHSCFFLPKNDGHAYCQINLWKQEICANLFCFWFQTRSAEIRFISKISELNIKNTTFKIMNAVQEYFTLKINVYSKAACKPNGCF